MTTFKGFGDFARRAPGMLERAIEVVGREVTKDAVKVAAEKMKSLNPPRSNQAHQHFADSWFYFRNSVRMGPSMPEVRPGDKLGFGNDAPHARILDMGRTVTGKGRRSLPKTYPSGRTVPAGRAIGSKSAPRGYSKPALLAARAAKERIIREAIAKANVKL